MSNLHVLQSSDKTTIWTEPLATSRALVALSEEPEAG